MLKWPILFLWNGYIGMDILKDLLEMTIFQNDLIKAGKNQWKTKISKK